MFKEIHNAPLEGILGTDNHQPLAFLKFVQQRRTVS